MDSLLLLPRLGVVCGMHEDQEKAEEHGEQTKTTRYDQHQSAEGQPVVSGQWNLVDHCPFLMHVALMHVGHKESRGAVRGR